jgi:hypothetical protein
MSKDMDMKLRFSKVTMATSAAAVLAAGGAAMAATGTLPGMLVSDAAPTEARPVAPAPAKPNLPNVPAVPDAKVPDVKVPNPDTKVPLPSKPGLPAVPNVSCDSVPPVVTIGSGIERAFTTPTGLKFTEAKVGRLSIGGTQKVCTVTQTWASRLQGQALQVTTLKVPSRTKLTEVAKGLDIRKTEAANVGGNTALASTPNGSAGYGILWAQHKDMVVYVSGGSNLPGGAKEQVKLVAETLQRVR